MQADEARRPADCRPAPFPTRGERFRCLAGPERLVDRLKREVDMRGALFLAGIALTVVLSGLPASAQQGGYPLYPWCAHYGGGGAERTATSRPGISAGKPSAAVAACVASIRFTRPMALGIPSAAPPRVARPASAGRADRAGGALAARRNSSSPPPGVYGPRTERKISLRRCRR